MVRRDDWAEPSLAARREASRLGIAIAAIMPIIATTMRSSINEKPSWRLVVMLIWCSLKRYRFLKFSRHRLSFVCEPRRARCVGGLLNNLYAKAELEQKEEISIFFDQNSGSWAKSRKGPDNFWQGGNDAFRQVPLSAFLCGPLCSLCLKTLLNAETTEGRKGPQRNAEKRPFCG